MRKAYVVAAKRSAIGSFMGGLTNMPLVDLGAAVLSRTIEEAGIDPANIDEVIVGNVIAAGLGQNIGRQVSIKAGVPVPEYALRYRIKGGYGSYHAHPVRIRRYLCSRWCGIYDQCTVSGA